MFKRWLYPSLVLFISVLVIGESSQAYTRRLDTSPTPSNLEVARLPLNPVRIFQRVRSRIMGTGWLGRMNRRNVKEWVNGNESGLIYRSTQGSIIGPYAQLRKWIPRNLPGGGVPRWNTRNAHHILEAQHAKAWNLNVNDLPCVNLSRRDHDAYHDQLRSEFKTALRRHPDKPLSKEEVWGAYQRVYAQQPDWLDAIKPFFED